MVSDPHGIARDEPSEAAYNAPRAMGAIVPAEVACRCVGTCDRDETGPTGCRYCRVHLPDPVYSPCPRLGFGCGTGCDCCTPEQQEAASA